MQTESNFNVSSPPGWTRGQQFVWDRKIFSLFSSRRRHTRYWRDWSSDVCSSDLPARRRRDILGKLGSGELALIVGTHALIEPDVRFAALAVAVIDEQIGRASCRERVWISVVAVS